MRPKIVILILLAAIGLVAALAVLKGAMGSHGSDTVQEVATPQTDSNTPPPVAKTQAASTSSNAVAIVEELRTAEVNKEVQRISELVADGAGDASATAAILAKLTHQEPDVRKAAVEALVQLNDTNAVPGLEQAAAAATDPHEKVALLDAVSYLKLPSVIEYASTMPESDFKGAPRTPTDRSKVPLNPRFMEKQGKKGRRAPSPSAPAQGAANPNQAQPVPLAQPTGQ